MVHRVRHHGWRWWIWLNAFPLQFLCIRLLRDNYDAIYGPDIVSWSIKFCLPFTHWSEKDVEEMDHQR